MASGEQKKELTFDLRGAYLRKINFTGASLRSAVLDRADFSGASFGSADFDGARLNGTILRGADLSKVVNLTVEQLRSSVIDESTRLPLYIDRTRLLDESRTFASQI